MGKRAGREDGFQEFERKARDWYPTPYKAVLPLAPHINAEDFIEPCAGDYRLVSHILSANTTTQCVGAYDIKPLDPRIKEVDLFNVDWKEVAVASNATCFITNPPFLNDVKSKFQLNRMIMTMASVLPTWMLLPLDFVANKRSHDPMTLATDIVPIGRVKWIEDSAMSSSENYMWIRFSADKIDFKFHPRTV